MNKKSTQVVLNGGLGNQLFQLAAGLFFSEGSHLILRGDLGKPRINSFGEIQLSKFRMPENVQIVHGSPRNLVIRKIFSYCIRQSATASNRLLKIPVELVTSLIVSFFELRKTQCKISGGIGFDPRVAELNSRSLLIGYFQCWQYPSRPTVYERLMRIAPLTYSEELRLLINEALEVKPIFIHIRLGDYKLENSFGIPDEGYLRESLKAIRNRIGERPIWVFSDEPDLAKSILSSASIDDYRLISEIDGSPEQTFELMRHGSGYVIANSTYSWWAAFLRKDVKAPVCMPEPWFRNQTDPSGIIPIGWMTQQSWKLKS
jgi:hypothetical protein